MRARIAWVVASLGFVAILVALIVAWNSGGGLKSASMISPVVALIVVAIGLLRWAYRVSSARPLSTATAAQLDLAVNSLAQQVLGQARDAIADWQLDDPKLATRWSWQANSAAQQQSGQPQSAPLQWVSGTAAARRTLADWFTALPRRRLAILGAGGSGKTSLAILLARELAVTRAANDPVPVLFPISGWDPDREELAAWLTRRLGADYPVLRAEDCGPDAPLALVRGRRLIPILDGLDELSAPKRIAVIRALNRATDEDPLILTCRADTYHSVSARIRMSVDATLDAEPLTADAATAYVTEHLAGPADPRWQRVVDLLHDEPRGPLASALTTPFNLWLLRATYLDPQADPTPLLDLPSADATRAHLLDRLVPALINSRSPGRDATGIRPRRYWPPEDAQRWLAFLADHLERLGTTNLAWWWLGRAVPRIRLLVGLTAGLTFAVMAGPPFLLAIGLARDQTRQAWDIVGGLTTGLVTGLAIGVVFFLMAAQGRPTDLPEPVFADLRLHGRIRILARQLILGCTAGIINGLVTGVLSGLIAGVGFGLTFGLSNCVAYTFAAPLELPVWVARHQHRRWPTVARWVIVGLAGAITDWIGIPTTAEEAQTPDAVFRDDRRRAIAGLVGGLIVGLATGLVVGHLTGLVLGVTFGLALGVSFGFRLGLVRRAWLAFVITRGWLVVHQRLPWSLLEFMRDMRTIGVLRQVGGIYQFRHVDLQDRLAASYAATSVPHAYRV